MGHRRCHDTHVPSRFSVTIIPRRFLVLRWLLRRGRDTSATRIDSDLARHSIRHGYSSYAREVTSRRGTDLSTGAASSRRVTNVSSRCRDCHIVLNCPRMYFPKYQVQLLRSG
jgi:hypothetical protein